MWFVLLFCLLSAIAVCGRHSRLDVYDDYYPQLFWNDANLNDGFDIDAFRQHQLDLHNHYRELSAVPLMTLDSNLTQQAQKYAEELALNDEGLVHCFSVLGCEYDGAGENLASAEGYTDVEANATVMWHNEIWDYNFCTTGTHDRNRPGREGRQTGHYTQLVWETSTVLGVGYARTSDRYKVYVVTRYKQHGNIIGQHPQFVKRPAFVLDTFEDDCNAVDGGLTDWMGPGPCIRSCGGGVSFQTKSCTNPKPSLNGRDCEGETKKLVQEWCNTHACSGDLSHRDLQCQARGEMADAHNFGGIRDCQLHCRISDTHFLLVGHVDDGTHCDYDSGACINGICLDMPDYVVGTPPPPTTSPIATTEVINNATTKVTATTKAATTKEATATKAATTTITTTAPSTTMSSTIVTSTQPETTRPTPSPTPARRFVEGAFSHILHERYQRLLTIYSGATDIVITNSQPRNARISIRFQESENCKPKRYNKILHGKEMMPFSEQIGRGGDGIMPMVSIQGPIKDGFKVIVYIRRLRNHTPLVTWSYWVPNGYETESELSSSEDGECPKGKGKNKPKSQRQRQRQNQRQNQRQRQKQKQTPQRRRRRASRTTKNNNFI